MAFPKNPKAEGFIIDLLEHADQDAASPTEVAEGCWGALWLVRGSIVNGSVGGRSGTARGGSIRRTVGSSRLVFRRA